MTNPNAIEEIMALEQRAYRLGDRRADFNMEAPSWKAALAEMRAILAALDAAGLAVVPKEATKEMRRMASADRMLLNEIGWVNVFQRTWAEMVAAFNPADWKPKT